MNVDDERNIMITDHRTASGLLVKYVSTAGTEEKDIEELYGRILAVDITAPENVPCFRRSPYDGYAFKASDTENACEGSPVILDVTENIRAGEVAKSRVISGTAIRLMTGAMIPEGADAVCMYEDTEYTETTVALKRKYHSGDNIISPGEDIKEGTLIAGKGSVADAGLTGTLASLGIVKVSVYKKPLAGIISTGDELVDAHLAPTAGKIRNSNRYTIEAALKGIGYDTVYLGHAKDSIEDTVRLIKRGQAECDVIISTGGVSAGDYDLVPEAMSGCGYEIPVRGVGMKPGMACAYGFANGKLMLALSGNPASSLTNLQCICFPALRKLAGYREYEHRLISMKLKEDCPKAGRGTRFIRGHIEYENGEVYLSASPEQGNAVMSSAIGCNAYGILSDMKAPVMRGTVISGFCV